MKIVDKLMVKASEVLEKQMLKSKDVSVESKFDYVSVLYFREYNHYCVYRAVYVKDSNQKVSISYVKDKFNVLKDMEDYFKENCPNVRMINVLSRDYVYLTKSGVNTDGSDFRLDREILSDSVFHCIHVHNCTDQVDLITNKLSHDLYNPYDTDYDKVNKSRWSMPTVSKYLENGRMCIFLRSKNCIIFDYNVNTLYTKPKELYYDLCALSKTNQLHITDCGDLGIQINFK